MSLSIKPDIKPSEYQVRADCNRLIEGDTANNLQLRIDHDGFEQEKIMLCQQLINCGDRVLDIGANTGRYTLLFSDLVSPGGSVTAIEPDQDNFLCLQRNLAHQVATGTVRVHQIALGDDRLSNLFFEHDSFELEALDFIKIGVSGHEPIVLRSLAAILKRSPKLKVLCEFSPVTLWAAGFSPPAFLEEMRAYGFRLIVQDKQEWCEGTFDEIEQALKLIPPSAVAVFISNLKSSGTIQDMNRQAAVFLEQYAYPRPLLENILLVADGAWRTVGNTLLSGQVPASPSITVPLEIKEGWQCRWVNQRDQNKLLSLFALAFGHSMPVNLWLWKYAGQCKPAVLAHTSGKVIAHYGGMPRSLWLHEEKLNAVQICDVMVDPSMRGILTRRGPFMRIAETFLGEQTGKNKAYRLAFGFPSDRALLLGEKLGLYARVDTLLEAVWPILPAVRLPFWFKIRPLLQEDNAVVDGLWKKMSQALTDYVVPQKDADFFRHRYLEHPVNVYASYLVSWRWFDQAVGIVVLRDHGPDQGVELLDLLGLPKAFGILLKVAQYSAGVAGRQRLFGWLTPNILTALPEPVTRNVVTNICIATPDLTEMAGQLHARWWLMSGDTDFR